MIGLAHPQRSLKPSLFAKILSTTEGSIETAPIPTDSIAKDKSAIKSPASKALLLLNFERFKKCDLLLTDT